MKPELHPMTEGRFSLRLFVAFLAVGLAFVGARVYTDWLSNEFSGQTRELLDNALLSVQHLVAAGDHLRDLEAAADDYPDLPVEERAKARQTVDLLWKRVDAELSAYLTLHVLAGGQELYRELPPKLRELDGAIQRLFADTDSGEQVQPRNGDVRAKANLSANVLRRLVRFDAEQSAESSMRIERTHHRVLLLDEVLHALSLALTLVIALWIWRVFRSYARLQHLHARLVEDRAEELEVFGRRVAHDLLSPLASLTYCLTAFEPASKDDPKLKDALGRARTCVQRARLLVDNVFDFARSGGAPSPDARANVQEVVEQVVEDARALDPSERPEIECEPVPDVGVHCSRGVLASILGNLVRNAIKYMRDSAVRHIAIRVVESGDVVRFEVEDTGPGVPPGLEQAIFEPYVRGEGVTQPGLGLGLATVKRFCEAYGGTVGVRSVSGAGSLFYFTLPRASEQDREWFPTSGKMLRDFVQTSTP